VTEDDDQLRAAIPPLIRRGFVVWAHVSVVVASWMQVFFELTVHTLALGVMVTLLSLMSVWWHSVARYYRESAEHFQYEAAVRDEVVRILGERAEYRAEHQAELVN
jgi:membrane protein implicated in regulation of membrane protease activity